jgi:hypothetical protein
MDLLIMLSAVTITVLVSIKLFEPEYWAKIVEFFKF